MTEPRIRSSLAGLVPREGATPQEIEAMRRRVYLQTGSILVTRDDRLGEWLRAAIDAWAVGKWGPRNGERA